MYKINFKKTELKKGEDYFRKVHATVDQKQFIDSIATIISKFLNIDIIPIKGFLWMVIKDWQVENKQVFSDLGRMSFQERAPFAQEFMKRLRSRLTKILVSPEDQTQMDDAILRAFEYYKANYRN